MKIEDLLLNETKQVEWAINLKDGGGFGVTAGTATEARRIAKQRMIKNPRYRGKDIASVERDNGANQDADKLRRQLQSRVDDSPILKTSHSLRKGYQRKLDAAESWRDLIALKRKFEQDLKPRMEPKEKAAAEKEAVKRTKETAEQKK